MSTVPDALATVIVVTLLIIVEAILLMLLFDAKAVLSAARRLAPGGERTGERESHG